MGGAIHARDQLHDSRDGVGDGEKKEEEEEEEVEELLREK